MTKTLVIEGWRRSSHSYALVNQNQLLHLRGDARFRIFHVDIPFIKPDWVQVDAGLSAEARQMIDSVAKPDSAAADVIYRISWPLRIHGGNAARIFVFGTSEIQWLRAFEYCGPSGSSRDAQLDAVEIITPSQWSRGGFLALGIDERRVHVIPHGVDAAAFRPACADERDEVRAALRLPRDATVFLSIGAMTWNKGVGPLLAAFALHHQRDKQAVLLLKGGDRLYGNLLSRSLQEAARLVPGEVLQSALGSVRYTGRNLTLSELVALYRASDAYISSYRSEGFSLPVLEALASGLLPIVTAGGPTDEFCPRELCLRIASTPTAGKLGGRFLEPDLASIVDCMQRAMGEESLRRKVAVEGPRWVQEHYTWARVSRLLADRLAA